MKKNNRSLRAASIMTCMMLLSSLSISAHAIEAYQATYNLDYKSISGTLKRTLNKTGKGQWEFKDNVSSFIASIEESSQLNIVNGKIQPQKYHYLRKVFGKKKKRDIDFDWQKKQAVNRDKKLIALQAGTQDRLSYQLQLQLDLQKGKRGKFSYPVTKNKKIDILTFVEMGTEVIKTPMGKIKSLKFKLDRGKNAKRETFIWFSLKHNFVITKLQQTESDGKSYSILLSKLS